MVRQRNWKVASARFIILAVALILLAWLVLTVVQRLREQQLNRGEFQAVYLVSGQIYFGHLQNTSGAYLTLTDVYLAQSNDTNTSSDGDNKVTTPSSTGLLKATNQVYGPENSMAIRADQVQFWQNLRTDSKVTKAIQAAQTQ